MSGLNLGDELRTPSGMCRSCGKDRYSVHSRWCALYWAEDRARSTLQILSRFAVFMWMEACNYETRCHCATCERDYWNGRWMTDDEDAFDEDRARHVYDAVRLGLFRMTWGQP